MTAAVFETIAACWICGGSEFRPVHQATFDLSEYSRQDPALAEYTGARVTLHFPKPAPNAR